MRVSKKVLERVSKYQVVTGKHSGETTTLSELTLEQALVALADTIDSVEEIETRCCNVMDVLEDWRNLGKLKSILPMPKPLANHKFVDDGMFNEQYDIAPFCKHCGKSPTEHKL